MVIQNHQKRQICYTIRVHVYTNKANTCIHAVILCIHAYLTFYDDLQLLSLCETTFKRWTIRGKYQKYLIKFSLVLLPPSPPSPTIIYHRKASLDIGNLGLALSLHQVKVFATHFHIQTTDKERLLGREGLVSSRSAVATTICIALKMAGSFSLRL